MRRTPEAEIGFVPLLSLDAEFVEIAIARITELDGFSAIELGFFNDGDELSRTA
jgi:hypothetical protein